LTLLARQCVWAPADSASHVALVEAWASAGNLKQDDQAIRKALELAPHLARTWSSASWVAIKARNWAAT
jgi:hypothetical protein